MPTVRWPPIVCASTSPPLLNATELNLPSSPPIACTIIPAVNWSTPPASPPPHDTDPGLALYIVTKNEWLDLYMGGDEFKTYIESEQKTVLKTVTDLGLVKK